MQFSVTINFCGQNSVNVNGGRNATVLARNCLLMAPECRNKLVRQLNKFNVMLRNDAVRVKLVNKRIVSLIRGEVITLCNVRNSLPNLVRPVSNFTKAAELTSLSAVIR